MSTLLEKASLVMIPSGYKEGVVYSEIPIDGSADLQFTRASDGTRVNSAGLVERVPWNLLQQSNQFNTTWTTNIGIFTGGQSGYDGSNDAWKFESDGGGTTFLLQSESSSGVNTISIYAKAGNIDYVRFGFNPSSESYGFFDLSAGTVVSQFNNPIDVKIESVGNGWFRCSVTNNVSATGVVLYLSPNGTGLNVADGAFIYIQDAQINEGTLKSYFPTTDRLNVPRLTYSGGCPSLLLEPQRTNLVTYSEQFDNAAWDKTSGGAAITANSVTSPDGYTNADTITGTGSSVSFVLVRQTITVPSAATYTFSGFFKYNNHPFVSLNLSAYDGGGSAYYNIQTGVVGTVSAGATATITDYGNGWYRCTLTAAIGASDLTGRPSVYVAYEDGTSDFPNTAAATGKAAYIWGAQFEASSYPTSYIPTTSTSVTRVADAAYKTGISSLIGQTEGVLFVEIAALFDDATNRRIALSDGTTSNSMYISYKNYTNQLRVEVISSGSSVFDYTYSVADITEIHKIALAYKVNDFAFYVDGTQVATDTSGAVPSSLSQFKFDNGAGGSNFYGKVSQAVLFPTRLTNAELAALTTL